jgi:hypothetical protein
MAKRIVEKPYRDPDHVSKRGVFYWFSPDWVRGTSGTNSSFGKIRAVKEKGNEVNLYIKSQSGNLSYIQGSIQQEFKDWHIDRSIDYILLGIDLDELIREEE